jgi:ferritin-like metal-binding protein YciE
MDPRELLLRELAEMLDVEETLAVQVLPKLRREVTEKHFQEALDEHLDQTRSHAERIEDVFDKLKEKPRRQESAAFGGLRHQFEEGVRTVGEPALLDLFCASSAAHTEHFEISAYHSLITLANILGEPEVVRLLEQNLHEEEEALEKVEKAIPERLSGQLAPA